jgi:hypothetical protein
VEGSWSWRQGLPFFDFLGKKIHVFLPEVANDLRYSQYAPRSELGGGAVPCRRRSNGWGQSSWVRGWFESMH